jgi:hypothetical protein
VTAPVGFQLLGEGLFSVCIDIADVAANQKKLLFHRHTPLNMGSKVLVLCLVMLGGWDLLEPSNSVGKSAHIGYTYSTVI